MYIHICVCIVHTCIYGDHAVNLNSSTPVTWTSIYCRYSTDKTHLSEYFHNSTVAVNDTVVHTCSDSHLFRKKVLKSSNVNVKLKLRPRNLTACKNWLLNCHLFWLKAWAKNLVISSILGSQFCNDLKKVVGLGMQVAK